MLPPLVHPAMAPAPGRVPARPVARWATLPLLAGWATRLSTARRVQSWRRQRAPRSGPASRRLMRWCRCSTVSSWCARRPNSAQSQSVGLPSKRQLVRRSNWLGRQPNSAHSQRSNLMRSQLLRPTKLMKSDRILMTNSNQATNWKNRSRSAGRTPPLAYLPQRLLNRALPPTCQRGQRIAPSPAYHSFLL